ncbi:MAG TPA: TAXI family TRAP transporter solute-binding subunit [Hyphomicrobiaceae bacterium]|nr:TAXI family TRAP transporter solute-binding subunit [Hyphomicrobiaceae bacterium]
MRQVLALIALLILTVVSATWLAIQFVETPEGTIRLAAGDPNGAYAKLARTWKEELERFGVQLLLSREEGGEARSALLSGKVDAAFLIGGYSTSLKYFSYGQDPKIMQEESNLRSIGRMFDEPIWVYYRRLQSTEEGLQKFKGKRILIGTEDSGTANVIKMLLHANGIPEDGSADLPPTKLIEAAIPDDAAPLVGPADAEGAADAAFIMLPSDNLTVKTLLDSPNDILLMDFEDVADAYLSKFPFLSRVVMHRGAHRFAPNIIPTANITLLATAPALVVRKDMHPALASLLTHVTVVKPKSAIDAATGYPVMFHKAGKFPHIGDPEYEVHKEATAYHKSGELPLVLRNVGPFAAKRDVPFWVTAVMSQHGTKILLLAIPILSVVIPLGRFVPVLYSWVIRRKLLYWYDRLKALELALSGPKATSAQVSRANDELQTIDEAVSRLRIPRQFSEQLYELRTHINLVEQRLSAKRARPQPERS